MASKPKSIEQLRDSSHCSHERRSRTDSVLGNRMDELHDFRKLKSARSSKWQKVRTVIDKEHTKLMIIEVPKNVSANESVNPNAIQSIVRHRKGARVPRPR